MFGETLVGLDHHTASSQSWTIDIRMRIAENFVMVTVEETFGTRYFKMMLSPRKHLSKYFQRKSLMSFTQFLQSLFG